MGFSHTLETTAAPERVWMVWTDVGRWPEWDTELERAALDGQLGLGAHGRLKARGGPESAFSITEFEPGHAYAFATPLPLGSSLSLRRVLGTRGGRTTFTHEVGFSGLVGSAVGLLLGPRYRRALPGVMENVRRLAEAQP